MSLSSQYAYYRVKSREHINRIGTIFDRWLSEQRELYKAKQLTDEQIKAVKEIAELNRETIADLLRFIDLSEQMIAVQRTRADRSQAALEAVSEVPPTTEQHTKEQQKRNQKAARARLLTQLKDCPDRTLHFISVPEDQVLMYGHVRIHKEDFEPYPQDDPELIANLKFMEQHYLGQFNNFNKV